MQIHSLYNHTKMIYTYSYYLCRATSLPNVRQHHLPYMDSPPQLPTFGSTSSLVRTMHHLNTWAPCPVSMEVDIGIRPWCSLTLPNYILCISSFWSTFDDTLELCSSQCKYSSTTIALLVIYNETCNIINDNALSYAWQSCEGHIQVQRWGLDFLELRFEWGWSHLCPGYATRGVHRTKHVRVYVSAQEGYCFGPCRITYTYGIHVIIHGYVHLWKASKKFTLIVLVW